MMQNIDASRGENPPRKIRDGGKTRVERGVTKKGDFCNGTFNGQEAPEKRKAGGRKKSKGKKT